MSFFSKFKSFFQKARPVYEDELEDILLQNDVGIRLTQRFLKEIKAEKIKDFDAVLRYLDHSIYQIFLNVQKRIDFSSKYFIIFGQNGSGKTTTIAKLVYLAQQDGCLPCVIPADTFRAAAQEQLHIWAKRLQCGFFEPSAKDPSSVVFDGCLWAKEKNFNVILIDTAGRLHTQIPLMEELKKITRTLEKHTSCFEKILILDGTIGQNSYHQVEKFHNMLGLSGLIMTKLDGTTKGGTLLSIANDFKIPIYAIGVGEKVSDLEPFNARLMTDALLQE